MQKLNWEPNKEASHIVAEGDYKDAHVIALHFKTVVIYYLVTTIFYLTASINVQNKRPRCKQSPEEFLP